MLPAVNVFSRGERARRIVARSAGELRRFGVFDAGSGDVAERSAGMSQAFFESFDFAHNAIIGMRGFVLVTCAMFVADVHVFQPFFESFVLLLELAHGARLNRHDAAVPGVLSVLIAKSYHRSISILFLANVELLDVTLIRDSSFAHPSDGFKLQLLELRLQLVE